MENRAREKEEEEENHLVKIERREEERKNGAKVLYGDFIETNNGLECDFQVT